VSEKCEYRGSYATKKKRGSETCVNAEQKKMVRNAVRRKKPW
jgi:hypothetical protein